MPFFRKVLELKGRQFFLVGQLILDHVLLLLMVDTGWPSPPYKCYFDLPFGSRKIPKITMNTLVRCLIYMNVYVYTIFYFYRMPLYQTRTIANILEPVAQQVQDKIYINEVFKDMYKRRRTFFILWLDIFIWFHLKTKNHGRTKYGMATLFQIDQATFICRQWTN